ncbi:MAG: aminotransferase class III-fold pyridoxal phosphate-dependent enzyme [Thermodesulfobacteriota bacterium]
MEKLVAESFLSDPKVLEAKSLILQSLRAHQGQLTGIRPPVLQLKKSYEELVDEFSRLRGGPLFYPYFGSGIGNGPLVELADGSVKYDFISGIGVHYLGHSHQAVMEAALDAALRDTVMQGNLQQNEESLDLARMLVAAANAQGAQISHCFFATSGAMANENALKLAFQKKSPADRLLAFEGGFAGRTLALSQVTDKPDYREGLPITLAVDYVPFFDPNSAQNSTNRALAIIERYLKRYPGRHAAMVFELVQGEGGFYPGDARFFAALMKLLRDNGVTVIVDEIQTFGRTAEVFAFQHYGLDEWVDIVTIGKLSQVCATLFREDYKPRPGLISQTFTASTAAIFASLAIIKTLTTDDYFGPDGRIARLHKHFVSRLHQIAERHPQLLTGPYGVGAMIACTPFQGEAEKVKKFMHELFDAGVIAFYCGSSVTRVRFLIPVGAVTFDDIDRVTEIVEATLVQVAETF